MRPVWRGRGNRPPGKRAARGLFLLVIDGGYWITRASGSRKVDLSVAGRDF